MAMSVDVITINTTDVAALAGWWAVQTGSTIRDGPPIRSR